MKTQFLVIMAFFGLIASSASAAPTVSRLYLFGGGHKPELALKSFFRASDYWNRRVLFIVWATSFPGDACSSFRSDARALTKVSIDCSPSQEESIKNPATLIRQMERASGIFFSGGDQSRIMKVFDRAPELLVLLHKKFNAGFPIAGTSAGTAIQSEWMIERENTPGSEDPSAVDMRLGVGLMRKGYVVDQHFLKRNRDKRLIAAMKKSGQPHGLGVDEGAAVLVLGSRHVMVFEGIARHYYESTRGYRYIDYFPGEVVDLSRFP